MDLSMTELEGTTRQLLVSARGPPQMMMVLSPASKVIRWSYGRYDSGYSMSQKHGGDTLKMCGPLQSLKILNI